MMPYSTVQALGQARLAELHDQARRDALARAASQARRQRSAHRTPRLLATVTRWARRPAAAILPGPAANHHTLPSPAPPPTPANPQTIPSGAPSSTTLNDLCAARADGSTRLSS